MRENKLKLEDLDTGILDKDFDKVDLNSELEGLGMPRCVGCYFFDCRCAEGLENKFLDDPSKEDYDSE